MHRDAEGQFRPVEDNQAAPSTSATSTPADTEAEVHRDGDAEGQLSPVEDNEVAVEALDGIEVGADSGLLSSGR